MDLLIDLVGVTETKEILASKVTCRQGPKNYIWTPSTDGQFSTTSTWNVTRSKRDPHGWMKWIWHKLHPKNASICMWKATFNYLLIVIKTQKISIPLASECNCYVNRGE